MSYTNQQLLTLHQSDTSGWVMVKNSVKPDPSVDVSKIKPASGAIESDGIWKVHISIDPEDMVKAIPIIHELFYNPFSPPMGMKVATRGLLNEDHQSGKEIALLFSRETEQSEEGQQKILFFLWLLATRFQKAGIKPDSKPPLTLKTQDEVARNGSNADKKNIERQKYDAAIQFRENEQCSYFHYRDEMALILDDAAYDGMVNYVSSEEKKRMVKKSELEKWSQAQHPQYLHNPLKRPDDFLYGVVLDKKCYLKQAGNKQEFLSRLKVMLHDQIFNRAQILDLFAEIKQHNGDYAFIHQQRNPMWDNFRLLFKSKVEGQDRGDFWHTATYQSAVKLLKEAYLARSDEDKSANETVSDANALIDYVRGNSPFHFAETSTRVSVKSQL